MPTVSILIDGYNLLFQSNLVGKGRGPGWLEQARIRLTRLLTKALTQQQLARTQVVFDAKDPLVAKFSSADTDAGHASDASHSSASEGPLISFAHEYAEADEMLEELIRKHPHPKTLTVVSSDHRVQRCARARRALVLDAEVFFEQLQDSVARLTPEVELPETSEEAAEDLPSAEEVDHWLREFTDDEPKQ